VQVVTEQHILDVAIIGGGIAGLTAAWHVRDLNVKLFESASSVGGRIRTVSSGDYWVNLGAHMYSGPGTEPWNLAEELGVPLLPIPGSITGLALEGRIYNPRRVEMLPFVLPLSGGERISFARAGLCMKRAARRYQDVEKYVPGEVNAARRRRMVTFEDGQSFAEFLPKMGGQTAAIYQCLSRRAVAEPAQLSAGAGIALVSHVLGTKGRGPTRSNVVVGGTEAVCRALGEQLSPRIETDAHIESVNVAESGVELFYKRNGQPNRVRAKQVILAVPAPEVVRIVPSLPPDLTIALNKVHYGAFLSVGCFLSTKEPPVLRNTYAVATPGRQFDFLFNHANPIRRALPGSNGGALMAFAGGPYAEDLMSRSDEAIEGMFVSDISQLLPEVRGCIRDVVVQRWPIGNAVAAPGRGGIQLALERGLAGDRLHLCGDYFSQLGGLPTATEAAVDAAHEARHALNVNSGPGPYLQKEGRTR
jgi:protoporphyrinogen/coproporphyrinogen III oxidase